MSIFPSYRDRTYCASPTCENKCGRKMSPEIADAFARDGDNRIWYGYFCGEPQMEDIHELEEKYDVP